MTNHDNLEPWQRVAIELGTIDYTRDGAVEADDHRGDFVYTEPACRLIAELRAEVDELRRDNRNMDSRIRGYHD